MKQTKIDQAENAYVIAMAIAEENKDDQCKAAINEQLAAIKTYRKAHPMAVPAVSGLPAEGKQTSYRSSINLTPTRKS